MGIVTRNTLTGIFTIVPLALTFYLLYWMVVTTERLLGKQLLGWLPPGLYQPGAGVVIGLVLAFVVGMLMHTYVVQTLFNHIERLLYRLPIVKFIYPALRDFTDYFSPVKKKTFHQVVSVQLGDDSGHTLAGMRAIGLVTREDLSALPASFGGDERILVYFPMSYMIGGYALAVPRNAIEPLDMSMEQAMRFVLTAGVTGNNGRQPEHAETPTETNP